MTAPLFDAGSSEAFPGEALNSLPTPLGLLSFEAIIDGVDVCGLGLSQASAAPSGGRLLRWVLDLFQAELLLSPVEPHLPEGMAVDGCWAGVWRVRAALPAEGVEFRCEWQGGHTWTEGGPDSGEGLHAWTWDDGAVMVTVGTEDAEALSDRASRGAGLPPRWAALIGPEGQELAETFGVTDAGLRLTFPDLAAGETCQAVFLIAWAPAPPTPEAARSDGRYIATWMAVQDSVEDVLAGAGQQ